MAEWIDVGGVKFRCVHIERDYVGINTIWKKLLLRTEHVEAGPLKFHHHLIIEFATNSFMTFSFLNAFMTGVHVNSHGINYIKTKNWKSTTVTNDTLILFKNPTVH